MSFQDGLIIGHEKNLYRIWTGGRNSIPAKIRGRLLHASDDPSQLPVVGDWVRYFLGENGAEAAIEEVKPRRSLLARNGAGEAGIQAMAANVDFVLISSSLNQDLNFNRLDRYLTMTFDSGALPVILLTKRDLNPQWREIQVQCEQHAPGVTVFAVSVLEPESWVPLMPFVSNEKVSALLGSSGVGKSTLTNRLLGFEALDTGGIRLDDDKGRHTTTSRSMWRTNGGGWIMDTPGMRELQLLDNEEGLSLAFQDVEDLFTGCRFGNCAHDQEPQCAVRLALEEGRLEPSRWENYRKLQREVEFQKRKAEKATRGRLPRRR